VVKGSLVVQKLEGGERFPSENGVFVPCGKKKGGLTKGASMLLGNRDEQENTKRGGGGGGTAA